MPETMGVFRVKQFGPLIVSIDAQGNNLLEQNKVTYNECKQAMVDLKARPYNLDDECIAGWRTPSPQ